MKNKGKKIAVSVLAAVISGGVAMASTQALAAKNTEKCYGVSKAKKNDCGTAKHACAGQASKDNDPTEWIYMLKGNCERIVGGSLKPTTASANIEQDEQSS